MASDGAVCKNRATVLSILETIAGNQQSPTQRAALKAVMEWVRKSSFDDIPETSEERQKEIAELKRKIYSGEPSETLWAELRRRGEGVEDVEQCNTACNTVVLEEMEPESVPEPVPVSNRCGIGTKRTDILSVGVF